MTRSDRGDRETALLAGLAACVSFLAFTYYFRRGDILVYGDAVAHINIARRLFDSQTPGLLQLGTVWLPLPHLLMVPFLISDWMWRSGVGGSIPSMVAYVLATAGIFRLVRAGVKEQPAAAWVGAVVFAANPNLLYLQSVAMTEVLYLALFIWSLVFFSEFVREKKGAALTKCGGCVLGACLTRYDGWILGAALLVAAWAVGSPRKFLVRFALLAACGPVLWFVYNAAIYRNPLEFANGPYSAKAIEQRSIAAGTARHPGSGNVAAAGIYFLKSAELNVSGTAALQRLWLGLAVVGALSAIPRLRRLAEQYLTARGKPAPSSSSWPALLLWLPLPFYTWSVAYGGVPVYVPVWWPHSYYNTRYGIELLPAFTVSGLMGIWFFARLPGQPKLRRALGIAALALVGLSYASIWRDPVCWREAQENGHTRMALEREVAQFLAALPADSRLLMYLGDHVGALQAAGVELGRVINEGNHRVWKQPSDPQGIWERALAEPRKYADYVVAFQGDPVADQVNKTDLTALAVLHVSGQPEAVIYRTGR